MNLRGQQDLLARLYTDADFRREFAAAPEKVGARFGLTAPEASELAAVVWEELEFFAESLVWKRRRAVEKLLPLTRAAAGEAAFAAFFREFAPGFNPPTVKKHFADARAFARFVAGRTDSPALRSAAVYERARLEFFGFEKRFAVCRLALDPTRPENLAITGAGSRRPRLAVWFRTGRRVRHFVV